MSRQQWPRVVNAVLQHRTESNQRTARKERGSIRCGRKKGLKKPFWQCPGDCVSILDLWGRCGYIASLSSKGWTCYLAIQPKEQGGPPPKVKAEKITAALQEMIMLISICTALGPVAYLISAGWICQEWAGYYRYYATGKVLKNNMAISRNHILICELGSRGTKS